MRGLIAACIVTCLAARAEAARYSIAVGTNAGLTNEDALRFANDDALQIDAAMREVGGVAKENAFLLRDANVYTLNALLAEVSDKLQHDRDGRASKVFFYYSGHGSEGELHLAGKHVSLTDLDAQLQHMGATLVVSVLDACRTSLAAKGARAMEPPVEVSGAVRASGFVELSASSQGEPAQESGELGGAVFTHYWSAGLRGAADSDGDGVVTLDELYRFAHASTLARTATAIAVQRPTFASVLSTEGDVVVSRTSAADARLVAAADSARYLVFTLPARMPVGELVSGHVLAVTRGRYLVVRRDVAGVSVAELDISRGEAARVADADYRAVASESWAARGMLLEEVRRWRGTVGLLAGFLPTSADAFGGGLAVFLERSFGQWALGGRLSYALSGVHIVNGDGVGHQFSALLVGTHTFYENNARLSARLSVGGEGGVERVVHADAAALKAAHLRYAESAWYIGAAARVGFVIDVPVGHYWSAGVALDGGVLARPERGSTNDPVFAPSLELLASLSRTF